MLLRTGLVSIRQLLGLALTLGSASGGKSVIIGKGVALRITRPRTLLPEDVLHIRCVHNASELRSARQSDTRLGKSLSVSIST